MKTKFTIASYVISFIACVFWLQLIFFFAVSLSNENYSNTLFLKIFLPFALIVWLILLFWGELRTKIISVEIKDGYIKVKRFYGLKATNYEFSEIKGWKYSFLTSKGKTYEYLYLLNDNNKKVIKISEFYHKNYFQVKDYIKLHFKDLGFEKFSFRDELKEIFV